MGNLCCGDRARVDEESNTQQNVEVSRYTPLLGPMLGGSFPASVAIFNIIQSSSDVVKLFVFGGIALGVFSIASGLAATTLGRTPGSVRYARFAALVGVTIVLILFAGALCSIFTSVWYKVGCGIVSSTLILLLVVGWMLLRW